MLVYMFRLNEWDMLVTAERIEEIIAKINSIAGDGLLSSTTLSSRSTLGYIPNFSYAVQPFDKVREKFFSLWKKRTIKR